MKRLWILPAGFCAADGMRRFRRHCGDNGIRKQMTRPGPPPDHEEDLRPASVETVWCILSYEGEGESLEYGAPYWLDVREADGSWTQVPLAENAGWDAMLYTLPSGEKQAFPCILSLFDYDFSGGSTFRVIKEIGEYTAAAEFTLTEGGHLRRDALRLRPHGGGAGYGDPAGSPPAVPWCLPRRERRMRMRRRYFWRRSPWASPASCGPFRTTMRAGPC